MSKQTSETRLVQTKTKVKLAWYNSRDGPSGHWRIDTPINAPNAHQLATLGCTTNTNIKLQRQKIRLPSSSALTCILASDHVKGRSLATPYDT